ncbi:hypothetical protein SPBR_01902 [Sporothrix brasiliensis 5110]|uniref:Uncharacterized protein n=1 Tax=Sporothrix brasiliensis 5110 TaxID=1398154 RepID=A0A0C2J255_9PEZI|nr:uncharacterized protein SPBR_01902 [Sporothrix brasiliensis 5110]KIH91147.1 hypothetical protein SPBR_01902 [Sporothrix brasiliensis 5110]
MTAHFGGDGIATADRQWHIGCRCGIPVHLPLASQTGERIVFLAMLAVEDRSNRAYRGPALIAATNRGNQVLFGNFQIAFTRTTTSRMLTSDSTLQTPVLGVFTDVLTAEGCCWKSIGVHMPETPISTARQRPSRLLIARFPYPPPPERVDERFNKLHALFSSATLDSGAIVRLRVRRRVMTGDQAPRCLGLCIEFDSGRTSILGQWAPPVMDAADTTNTPTSSPTITDIFPVDSADLAPSPSLCAAITFHFTPDGTYVTDIVVGNQASGPFDAVVSQGEHFVWWFSEAGDLVQTWEPTYASARFPDPLGNGFHQGPVWSMDSKSRDD